MSDYLLAFKERHNLSGSESYLSLIYVTKVASHGHCVCVCVCV